MARTIAIYVAAFLIAVFLASAIASVFSTQFVLAGLTDLGIEIPSSDRLSMTLADFGILPVLATAIAICFAVGFTVAAALRSLLGGDRRLWFSLAGATAFPVELLIVSAMLGLMPIPGARSTAGMFFQAIAGGIGGWIFAVLITRFAVRP